mmetsp:Transcript_20712/g.57786  ORF Transcript_20712/g.57786 Transcript_20712/m.57786 type:complete len:148 (+) Transcript_20712:113-556(+)
MVALKRGDGKRRSRDSNTSRKADGEQWLGSSSSMGGSKKTSGSSPSHSSPTTPISTTTTSPALAPHPLSGSITIPPQSSSSSSSGGSRCLPSCTMHGTISNTLKPLLTTTPNPNPMLPCSSSTTTNNNNYTRASTLMHLPTIRSWRP